MGIFCALFCLILASCGIYNSNFDCPPGEGVGCASVGEVMEMIVESDEGEDLFIKNRGRSLLGSQKQGEKRLEVSRSGSGELVLVEEER